MKLAPDTPIGFCFFFCGHTLSYEGHGTADGRPRFAWRGTIQPWNPLHESGCAQAWAEYKEGRDEYRAVAL